MTLTSTDPRTGVASPTALEATSDAQVDRIATAAASAADELRRMPRAARAALLRRIADEIEADRDALVAIAAAETGLAEPRLNGELTRSAFQFRLFADAVDEGGYLEAVIDHAGDTPMGPGPDIRRMLVPIGPIAVFGSSNFPFAFSVLGGDTASALAAGNPVVVKAHSSHPLTSARSFAALEAAARAAGAPDGVLGIVYGQQAGAALVAHPRVAAVGFTGSLHTGRVLREIIESRENPIPFYGELSSLNPLIVTPGAVTARGADIAAGLFASVTGSAGQLCTKPGVVFIPRDGDAVVDEIVRLAKDAAAQPLLNGGIHASLFRIEHALVSAGGAHALVPARVGDTGFTATPAVLEIDAAQLTPAATEEAFGPLVVVVRYDTLDDVLAALDAVPDSLTATVHAQPDELDAAGPLVDDLSRRVGRLVFNGYPTGVRVSWGQHHGGPWPATNTLHTSVGVTAIRRFLRPFAWQDAPEALLPIELRDATTSVPRRVDGILRLATLGA
ncbi:MULTISPECIES: aldehyde dehydrogenase (NADP(+)) [Microbacterium]|jgi:NADP-dependent aldehyde dehydrogenase|uniref:aldehyde dehydrogenase (NADP(+)) n=2 Tax=Microbacteriaceae TaxID=85023 RepID=UPI0006FE6656|nr:MULTISPECIES: aldehyde dehydrogenase (NADP(+)) [unclassified Microbacterium]KQR94063.1 aldehyde dehydrogenase [Microbacterium sp. Leaf347]MBN9198284.1 aldehyde dehydrogenase (NADP(+)) [Microbacterium ginsengisoli]MCK9915500.1 aldehyde dehydrogenase (NADP(+)) [Microbacteriaceae bacterium K1510]OJU78281.1 MAG: aldehyde dehydrogenase (NADP(+)) [Microbacterium sp. 71-23]